MKKVFYIISVIVILCAQSLYAQITLEHSFDEMVNFNIGIVNGEANYISETVKYPENSFYKTIVSDDSYTIKIYNSDYSLNMNQTYYFTPPSGYKVFSVTPSKNYFNDEDSYEFIVTFKKTSPASYDNTEKCVIVYDQEGNIIKDFGTGAIITVYPFLFIIDNKYKLLVYRYYYDENNDLLVKTEIYSLYGRASTGESNKSSFINQSPYPNPVSSIITLPYQLKQGEVSEMRIYDINGRLIETKQIDFIFDKIMLNVSEYAKGLYTYEVNGLISKFIVK